MCRMCTECIDNLVGIIGVDISIQGCIEISREEDSVRVGGGRLTTSRVRNRDLLTSSCTERGSTHELASGTGIDSRARVRNGDLLTSSCTERESTHELVYGTGIYSRARVRNGNRLTSSRTVPHTKKSSELRIPRTVDAGGDLPACDVFSSLE